MKVTLLKAIRIVASVDSGEGRLAVFHSIVRRRRTMRLVYRLHGRLKKSRRPFLSTLMVAAYGALGYGVFAPRPTESQIVSVATFANEARQMRYLSETLGGARVSQVVFSRLMLFHPRSLAAMAALAVRYMRVTARLNAQYDFMPACRAARTVAYYLAFSRMLRDAPYRAVAVASNYSPDGVALASAAQARGIPSLYIAHAFYGANAYVPDLGFELVIVSGQAALDEFANTKFAQSPAVFRGIEGQNRPMRAALLKERGMAIGVFLTGVLNEDGLASALDALSRRFDPSLLLIRQHPVSLTHHDLSPFVARYPRVRISSDAPLADDIARCELIISGNSNVHLQALKFGVPCVYHAALDPIMYDYKRFVKYGAVFAQEDLSTLSLDDLRRFYAGDWENRFRYFDAGYGKAPETLAHEVRHAVENIIGKA